MGIIKRVKTTGSIDATQFGFRASIYHNGKFVRSHHFKAEPGFDDYRRKCDDCYSRAKQYLQDNGTY